MERSMAIKRLSCLPLLILLSANATDAAPPRTLVLATSTNSSVPALTTQEARKLFMGVPLEKDGAHPIPLLNTSDALTYEVFLQKVAFMSASVYESQTLSVVFRLGGKRPDSYSDLPTLVQTLQQNPGTVTYLWEEQVKANQGIKTVNVLWQGSQE
jgi:hypothetical protein